MWPEIPGVALFKQPLSRLRQLGIQVCIDDFGTGYLSLNYLKHLPVDTLKVDRAFILNLESEPDNLQILAAILNLAQVLHLEVVAEGIETDYQAQQLTDMNCRLGQGYWFAKPMDDRQASDLLLSA